MPRTPLGCFLVYDILTMFLRSESFKISKSQRLPLPSSWGRGRTWGARLTLLAQHQTTDKWWGDGIQTTACVPQGTALGALSPVRPVPDHLHITTRKENQRLSDLLGWKRGLSRVRASGAGLSTPPPRLPFQNSALARPSSLPARESAPTFNFHLMNIIRPPQG